MFNFAFIEKCVIEESHVFLISRTISVCESPRASDANAHFHLLIMLLRRTLSIFQFLSRNSFEDNFQLSR